MASVTAWYFPIWSKLELYRSASDFLAEPVSSIPISAFDAACIFADSQFISFGFNRSKIEYDFSYAEDGSIDFKVRGSDYGNWIVLQSALSLRQCFVIQLFHC